eukprot:TRINITY_DN28259_c0_g1_i1.p1 TRINITY_DN28259_c0_g1~~TRINITY_DN28259_c0_g1_i1.p1  ORF type:complete len:639 (+),score=162.16 TRINITY_DN28259_c0_g1_i1:29-1945(+)
MRRTLLLRRAVAAGAHAGPDERRARPGPAGGGDLSRRRCAAAVDRLYRAARGGNADRGVAARRLREALLEFGLGDPDRPALPISERDYAVLFMGCTAAGDGRLGEALLDQMREDHPESSTPVSWNAAVRAQCGWRRALRVLPMMLSSRAAPNAVTYNSAAQEAGRAAAWAAALRLLTQSMQGARVAAGERTLTVAIRACEAGGRWRLAVALAAGPTADAIAVNAAAAAARRAAQWQLSLRLVGDRQRQQQQQQQPEWRPDAHASAAAAAARGASWAQALQHAIAAGPSSPAALGAALDACSRRAAWALAVSAVRRVFGGLRRAEADSLLQLAAICQKVAAWRTASGVAAAVLAQQRGAALGPAAEAVTVAVSAAASAFRWSHALSIGSNLRRAAPAHAAAPAHSAAITACAVGAQWQGALRLLREEDAAGVAGSKQSESAAAVALIAGRLWAQALQQLRRTLRSSGDAASVGGTVTGLAYGTQWQAALGLCGGALRSAAAADAAAPAIGAAAHACKLAQGWNSACGAWAAALRLLDFADALGAEATEVTYTCVLHACRRAGSVLPAGGALDRLLGGGTPEAGADHGPLYIASLAALQESRAPGMPRAWKPASDARAHLRGSERLVAMIAAQKAAAAAS